MTAWEANDPEGLSVLRYIQNYSDLRKHGLTEREAEELLEDQRAWESATTNREESENDEIR